MICLDNTDTLEGGASVNAVVDYTVHGLVGTTFTNIAQGQLSDTDPSILYTAATAISIVSVIFVNTHTSAVTVNLYLDPANAGTPRRLIPKTLSLGIGYSMHFDGQRCSIIDANGNLLRGFAAHHEDHENAGADEISVAGLSGLLANDQHVLDAEVLAVAAAKGVNADITSMTGLDNDGIPLAKVANAASDGANTDITSLGALSGVQTIPTIDLTGGQIAFPATAVPSADPNTLDDYEEGTWTIGITFGGASSGVTYSSYTGAYIKIGNIICISGNMSLTSKGTSTGGAIITGLPFTAGNGSQFYSPISLRLTTVTFANVYNGYVIMNTTTVGLREQTEAGAFSALNNTNFANTSTFMIGGTYHTA